MNTEPSKDITDPTALMLGQLAHLRGAAVDKLRGLSLAQLTTAPGPPGWSPVALLNHLVHVERRWVTWGFLGRPVADPHGDTDADGDFVEPPSMTTDPEALLDQWAAVMDQLAAVTERVAAEARLDTRGRIGGRFTADPPTLGWILLHLIQEFARHVGQLDLVRERLDGRRGE